MPNKNEKGLSPSPRLLRRILGEPVSGSLEKEWPELKSAFAGREIEMPGESEKVNWIKQMGPIMKMLNPDAYAATNPFGVISVNKGLIEKDKQNLDDVLVHELAHIGQGKKGFLRKFFEPSRVEGEAINREGMRKVRRGDINLR